MKIGIVGTGYVGLVTGTCFAEMGYDVTCVDIDERKIETLKSGKSTIYESGLEFLIKRNIRENRLRFTTDLQSVANESLVLFLALPTPPGENGSADLSYIETVAGDLASIWSQNGENSYHIVVNKSTVPVGTADRVGEILGSGGLEAGVDYDVVSNPEFLREGVAVADFMKPERVVIGTTSERAAEIMKSLYEPFVRQGNPILVMDERSSEMTKYASNSFLATKISFINEIANLCERVGANVDEVRKGMGLDSRIGNLFLYPGIGFGGSCFPKDVQALRKTAADNGYDFRILNAVLAVNDSQRDLLAGRVADRFTGTLSGRKVAVWGLSFKAGTDDIRESPAHTVIDGLLSFGAEVYAFDPEAIETTRQVYGDRIHYGRDQYEVLADADVLVICTEWHEFRRPNFERMRDLLQNPLIFDGRNLYRPLKMKRFGWEYYSIGRDRREMVEA